MDDLRALLPLYLDGLWRRRWSVVLVAWAVCLAGWLAVALLPNRYTSTAQIYVDTESVLGPLMKDLAVTPDIDRQVEVMRRTLLSRPNLENLVQMADLDPGLAPDDAVGREALLDGLARRISVVSRWRNLFEVSYETHDPREAYRVVDSAVNIFIEQNVGLKQRDADSARQFIEKQIADYEAKLREADLAVARFKREHANELGGVNRAQQQLENAEAGLRSVRSEFDSAVWRRDQLRTQLASTPRYFSAAEAARGPSPSEQRLAELRGQLEQLLLTYTEQHPDVVGLKGLIAQAEAVVAAEQAENGGDGGSGRLAEGPRVPNPVREQLQADLRNAEASVADLRRRVEIARGQVEQLTAKVAETPDVEANLTRLVRDYDVLLERYRELTNRRETAQLGQRLDTETERVKFWIVDPPVVPAKPSGPPYGLLMAGVLLVGVGSGVAFGLLRVLMDGTLRSVAQLRDAFGLPVLGAVSAVRSALGRRLRLLESASLGAAALMLLLVFGGVFYLYQLRPTKPDLAALAQVLRAEIGQRADRFL